MHNQAALARGDANDVWVLYRYRGLVLQVDADLEVVREWFVPLPEGFDPDAPYIRQMGSPQREVVGIVRAEVASDITMDDWGHVLITRDRAEDGKTFTQLLVYDQSGRLLAVSSLTRRASRVACSGDTVFTLERRSGEPPSIETYALDLAGLDQGKR